MSVEPVPNRDVVGEDDLAAIRSIGYAHLERWSQRLLDEAQAFFEHLGTIDEALFSGLQHLAAVASLLEAIEGDRVEQYLATEFTCPED